MKLRKEIAEVCTTLTFGLAYFLGCITALEEKPKAQLSALLDKASKTMMYFGTLDDDCFQGPIADRLVALNCEEWCSTPFLLEAFQNILDQLETGVKTVDYEDIAPIIFSAEMVHPRWLTPKMVLLNRWINTARVLLKQ